LRRNSNDEVVWRWLKESIASYPQNWVRLTIADNESYGVVLYPEKRVDSTTILSYNRELGAKRLPPLREDKRYLPIAVYQGNIICPSWSGLIDIEEAKLVYFYRRVCLVIAVAEQSLAADGARALAVINPFHFSLNTDRAPRLKARRYADSKRILRNVRDIVVALVASRWY
jgi:hypothetical protein